jgi:Fe-S cluster biogenesis protein NfuA
MFIQTEKTPNPETMKFIPGVPVMERGTAEFKSIAEAGSSPLAQRLFKVAGVSAVFFGRDFISVTKDEAHAWDPLKTLVLAAILDHFTTGFPVMDSEPVTAPTAIDDEISLQIIELLETRVRPAVQGDGGDIMFDRFEDGVVYLRMRGACAGCPSSTMTLKSGIENMLKHFVPEVVEVRASDAL